MPDTTPESRLAEHADELATWLREIAADGEDFAREQIPLVAEEIVAWHFWKHTALTSFCLLALCVFIPVVVFTCLKVRAGAKGYWCHATAFIDDRAFSYLLFAGFGAVASLTQAAIGCHHIIKTIVAPRLVILDYLKDLT